MDKSAILSVAGTRLVFVDERDGDVMWMMSSGGGS